MSIPVSTYAASGSTTPAGYALAVTPGTTVLPEITRGIYIGVDGNLEVAMAADGSVVTFLGVAAGSLLPLRVSDIRAGTTASGIVAVY